MSVARLAELDRETCMTLLSTATIGRAVYTIDALPVCVPVTFTMHGNAVVFRADSGSALAAAVDGAVVAFEVDSFDEVHHTGWSVLVTGTATAVRDVATIVRLEQTGLVAWAGERNCWIRIVATIVTGRRVGATLLAC